MSQPETDTLADRYFVKGGQGPRRPLFPGVDISAVCGDEMMFSVVHLEPGSVVPDHAHPHEQMGIMISGRLEFTIGGSTQVVGPGDIWRIPGNVRHSVKTLDEPAVALDVFHPIREDYR